MCSAERPLFIVNVEGVVRRGERYLLTVRSERESHAPGTLSLPGGKVEYSDAVQDTLEHTLKREILEETGVAVDKPVYLESKWFRSRRHRLSLRVRRWQRHRLRPGRGC
jgi:8-oxo-dGTP diphosphatase